MRHERDTLQNAEDQDNAAHTYDAGGGSLFKRKQYKSKLHSDGTRTDSNGGDTSTEDVKIKTESSQKARARGTTAPMKDGVVDDEELADLYDKSKRFDPIDTVEVRAHV